MEVRLLGSPAACGESQMMGVAARAPGVLCCLPHLSATPRVADKMSKLLALDVALGLGHECGGLDMVG